MTRFRDQQPRDESALEENVVKIYRCAKVVRGGRRFSFAAMVVVGDRRGHVGVGYGKATEVPFAVEKAKKAASRNLRTIKLVEGTIAHRTIGRHGASRVILVPASRGTGVIAGATVRAVLELAGVTDVLTKSYGSNSPKNLVRATFSALVELLDHDQVSKLRGVKVWRRPVQKPAAVVTAEAAAASTAVVESGTSAPSQTDQQG